MLGLCWTPGAVQGMQKVASTMPSNPEQLLGAILVRRDIFQRFESTMHDTCLDANNLLEYLFSLYNSTATPSERENFPTPQQIFRNVRRDTNHNKKASIRMSPHFDHPHPANSRLQLPHTGGVNRLQDTPRSHQAGLVNAHHHHHHQRKRQKIEQVSFEGIQNNYGLTDPAKSFDGHPVFPGINNASNAGIKMELAPDTEAAAHAQASSPLPPFSQIRRHGTPYSPGASQFSESLPIPSTSTPLDNIRSNFTTLDTPLEQGLPQEASKINSEEVVNQSVEAQEQFTGTANNNNNNSSNNNNNNNTPEDGSNIIITASGRKKVKRHQCFCGAWFTRADNLKRHIRKCHEEKLEKLNAAPLDLELGEDAASGQLGEYPQIFSSSSEQDGSGATNQQQQEQEPGKGQDEQHHLQQQQQQQQHQQQQQQQQQHLLPNQQQMHLHAEHQQHHQQQQQQQQQQHHPQQQQHESHIMPSNNDDGKGGNPLMKWSCFCGEHFEDHRQLVEHTRIHEVNS